MRTGFLSFVFIVTIAVSGCATPTASLVNSQPVEPLPGNPQALIAQPTTVGSGLALPALPEMSGVRSTSGGDFTPILQRGNASYLSASNAVPDPVNQSLLLAAGAGEASWTIHQFAGFDVADHPSGIELVIYDPDDQTLFLALANYEEQRWELSSVELVEEQGDFETIRVPLANDAAYRSPTDAVYFAVIAFDEVSVEVRYAALQLGIRTDVWVQGLAASDAAHTDWIEITWDAVPEATGYVIYYRFLNFPGNLLLLTETTDPSFTHSVTEPVDKEVIPEEPYMYFVAAIYGDGTCSQLTGYDVGVTAPPVQ